MGQVVVLMWSAHSEASDGVRESVTLGTGPVLFFSFLFQDTLFFKQVTTLSFWPILPLHKLQTLAWQLRGSL